MIVAVAGGTGKLGRAIIDGIKERGGDVEVVILARQSSSEKEKSIGARIIAVDYTDVSSLAKTLKENNIHTIIASLDSNAGPDAELNLIQAAEQSSVTKRYIPTIWGIPYTEEMTSFFPPAAAKRTIIKTLESTSSLEWTSVYNGFFIDFFIPGVTTYFDPLAIVLDIQNNTAAIPGTGDEKIVFTYTMDIGRYIAELLFTERWERESYIIGDKISWNDFIDIAQIARSTEFTIHHDSIEKLKAGQVTELPSHPHLYPFLPKEVLQGMSAAFGLMFANGDFDLQPIKTLNQQFPDIKPRSVKELVDQAWRP